MVDVNNVKQEHIYSGIIGLAVGDALGVPVEFRTREEVRNNPITGMVGYGTYNKPAGTFSDDTSMTLATLDGLCDFKNLQMAKRKIMDNFSEWLLTGKYTSDGNTFDIGNTTKNAIYKYMHGVSVEECGDSGVFSNGNGSLMRILPLIFFIYNKFGTTITEYTANMIYGISGLTHNHIISKESCLYYIYIGISILDSIVKSDKNKDIKSLIESGIYNTEKYITLATNNKPNILREIGADTLNDVMNFKEKNIKSTGYVIDTLTSSIWTLANTDNYRNAVLMAVNLGYDTDTTAAVTGGLAGIFYGLAGIPKEWINELSYFGRDTITRIVNKFYNSIKGENNTDEV